MKFKIKQKLKFKDSTLILFDFGNRYNITSSNLLAFDKNGFMLWSAECPLVGHYSEFEINENSNTIEANQDGVMFYEIGYEDGKIKSKKMRK